jgi:phosphoribosylaminoimidazolecarboxamide formyltransferase/IMP cyclohydrolase
LFGPVSEPKKRFPLFLETLLESAMGDLVAVRRALLSVSDKAGIADFARRLSRAGVELVSTGGTAKLLREAGLAVRDVADLTGFSEMMGGRVKTLHPRVHGGLLARRDDPAHIGAMEAHGIAAIDLLVVNLYPFEATVAKGASFEECVENIDIGGPAMIRAGLGRERRRSLAAKAYAATAAYDAAISQWFAQRTGDDFPAVVAFCGRRRQALRYGENPHQSAALYLDGEARPGAARARQIQGKELSYNNLNDADAAFELVSEFDPQTPAVAIIKHANPCGVALGVTLADAYDKALACDPVSAFGGVIALNRALDGEGATRIAALFAEVVIAPDAEGDALAILAAKKNVRVLLTGSLADPAAPGRIVRPLAGGFLLQSRDNGRLREQDLKIVTKRRPDAREIKDMLFAFTVAKHVKSNAIVYAKNGATVGLGAGQMSRVDSSRIAARKAEDAARAAGFAEPLTKGSVVASDAFFPFADGLLAAAEAGARAVIQPGGSIRDEELIAAADAAGLAMAFTGQRHFRH